MPTSTRQDTIAKLHRTIGETVKRPVGADDPVRPWGNGKFAAGRRKTQYFPIRRRGGVLPLPRRMQKQIRTTNGDHAMRPVPHWCVPICGVVPPGGVEPLPNANLLVFAKHPNHMILQVRAAGRTGSSAPTQNNHFFTIHDYFLPILPPPLRYDENPPAGTSCGRDLLNAAQYVFVSVPRSFPARSGFCRPRGR